MAVKWYDWEIQTLTELNAKGVKREVIAECLGRSKYAVRHKILNMGLPNKYLAKQKKYNPDYADEPPTSIKGVLSEFSTWLKFMRLGYEVYVPINPKAAADGIVMDINTGKTCKIQVKTATYRNDVADKTFDYYHCNLYKHRVKGEIRNYTANEVDFFIVALEKHNIDYVIPFSHTHNENINDGPKRPRFYPHREKRKDRMTNVCYESYANAYYYIDKFFKGQTIEEPQWIKEYNNKVNNKTKQE